MFHFKETKLEKTEQSKELESKNDEDYSMWRNIPFKEKENGNKDEQPEFKGQKDSPWIKIPHEKLNERQKEDSWKNIPFHSQEAAFTEPKKNSETNEGKESDKDDNTDTNENKGLTDEQKEKIKAETGWSDEIINAIRSWEEYEIYKKAGLVEAEINGKKCLIRTDIDWDQKDDDGLTNRERVAMGLAPLDKNGKPIELHHIGQHADSPLAELTRDEHRGAGNDTILHDKTKTTEVHGEGNNWDKERTDYWKDRANNTDVEDNNDKQNQNN